MHKTETKYGQIKNNNLWITQSVIHKLLDSGSAALTTTTINISNFSETNFVKEHPSDSAY